jgi:hypothetical protein
MSSLIQITFHTSYNGWLPMHKAIKQKKHSMPDTSQCKNKWADS